MDDWSIVIPVKPAAVGKSRLLAEVGLVRAIALDTIAAAAAATRVARVLVPTSDAELAALLAEIVGVEVVVEDAPAGIRAALERALAHVDPGSPRGALLGDLPALRPAELDAALLAAGGFDRAFVADAEGTGTTLVTARGGVAFESSFGDGSAARHRGAGLVELDLPGEWGLRRDIDDAAHLESARLVGLGPRTRAARPVV